MKVLADHCVPTGVIELLRGEGHHVERLVDVGNPRADDKSVAALAFQRDAVLLTSDADFSRRTNFQPHRYKGIIVLKDLAEEPERVGRRLARLLARADERHLERIVAVVDRRSVHLRH